MIVSTRPRTLATLTAALLAVGALSSVVAQEQKTPMDMQKMPMDMHQGSMERQVEMAKTQAENEAVAKRFEDEAAQLEKQAAEHERLAKHYRSGVGVGPKGNAASLAAHCDNLVKSLRASAVDAREMARLHREIGKELGK
jgi:hypothetical protein